MQFEILNKYNPGIDLNSGFRKPLRGGGCNMKSYLYDFYNAVADPWGGASALPPPIPWGIDFYSGFRKYAQGGVCKSKS